MHVVGVEERHPGAAGHAEQLAQQPLQRTPQPQFQLFDLAKDPGEKTDVLAKNPEVAEKLKARLAALVAASRSR